MPITEDPKIYHIAHTDRLASIITEGYIWSHAEVEKRNLPGTDIGMAGVKQRRLTKPMRHSAGNAMLGECVPFHFCPQSLMLYTIHQNSLTQQNPELEYEGGQELVVHLEADLNGVVIEANKSGVGWAFTDQHALMSDEFFTDLTDLQMLDWEALYAHEPSAPRIGTDRFRSGRQAEFLIHRLFPWRLVERIGTMNENICDKIENTLRRLDPIHQPEVIVEPSWYCS